MDYDAVATAIATAAGTVTYPDPDGHPTLHLNAHGFAREAIDPPTFEVGELEIPEDQSFGGAGNRLQTPLFVCRLYVARSGAAEIAHPLLRRFLGDTGDGSVKAALESDRTLGGLVDALKVEKRYGYGVYEVAGTDYYGARFDVRVWGRG